MNGLIIDFVADYVCPWCWIGRYRLELALNHLRQEQPTLPVRISQRPFELNPDMPAEGMDRDAYAASKFGSVEAAQGLWARVASVAAMDGLEIKFDTITRQPNTLNAHRLVAWAGTKGRGLALSARLYPAFFREGADLGDLATLAQLAGEVGLPMGEATGFLASDIGIDDTRRMLDAAQNGGIDGVPVYIFNRKTSVIGAQPLERLLEAMGQALEPEA
jgi:predicted DsbA family dithiol-disulfide isomerase